jgi:hypothetical protein
MQRIRELAADGFFWRLGGLMAVGNGFFHLSISADYMRATAFFALAVYSEMMSWKE